MNAFLDTFFKPNLIAQYLPSILKGVLVTIEIALAVVITGLALGLAARRHPRASRSSRSTRSSSSSSTCSARCRRW